MEINNNLSWKLIASITNVDVVEKDFSGYEEICVMLDYNNALKFSTLIPVMAIPTTAKNFSIGGYYALESTNSSVGVLLSTTKVQLTSIYINNESMLHSNSYTLYIYAR